MSMLVLFIIFDIPIVCYTLYSQKVIKDIHTDAFTLADKGLKVFKDIKRDLFIIVAN